MHYVMAGLSFIILSETPCVDLMQGVVGAEG